MAKSLFRKKKEASEFMIVAHRGFWGGNIIQNTRQSSVLAMRAGADVVEVDVCRSKDGVYYLFHNRHEEALLGVEKPFCELMSQEIDECEIYNSINERSGYYLERLADYLAWLPGDYLVNLDRSWHYWEDEGFFDLLVSSGKKDQLLLKSPVDRAYLNCLINRSEPLQYFPILKSRADWELVSEYSDLPLIGVELVVTDLADDLLDPIWLEEWNQKKMMVLANAEKLGEGILLFGDLNDDAAVLGEGDPWQSMLDIGINAIQTDWPNFLSQFRSQ